MRMPEPLATDWLQSLIAFFALVGLCYYCFETHVIRTATLAQADSSRRPFFDFELSYSSRDGEMLLVTRNVGEGHALNVRISFGNGERIQDTDEGIAAPLKKDIELLRDDGFSVKFDLITKDGISLTYEDLSGLQYWTTLTPARMAGGERVLERYIVKSGGGRQRVSLLERIERWNRTLEG